MKKFIKVFVVILILLLVLGPLVPVFATDGQVIEETQSWLAHQLEVYGVPTAISATISSLGTGGAIWLFTRGFKNSKKQMVKALESMGLSSDSLYKIITKLDKMESRLNALEELSMKNMETTYNDRVIPLLNKVEAMQSELFAVKDDLKNGALKIINLLTEGEPLDETIKSEV